MHKARVRANQAKPRTSHLRNSKSSRNHEVRTNMRQRRSDCCTVCHMTRMMLLYSRFGGKASVAAVDWFSFGKRPPELKKKEGNHMHYCTVYSWFYIGQDSAAGSLRVHGLIIQSMAPSTTTTHPTTKILCIIPIR